MLLASALLIFDVIICKEKVQFITHDEYTSRIRPFHTTPCYYYYLFRVISILFIFYLCYIGDIVVFCNSVCVCGFSDNYWGISGLKKKIMIIEYVQKMSGCGIFVWENPLTIWWTRLKLFFRLTARTNYWFLGMKNMH